MPNLVNTGKSPVVRVSATPVIKRSYDVYEVFYIRDGEKLSRLFPNRTAGLRFRRQLRRNKRKFAGARRVTLVELRN